MGLSPFFFLLHFLDRLRIVVNRFTVKILGEAPFFSVGGQYPPAP